MSYNHNNNIDPQLSAFSANNQMAGQYGNDGMYHFGQHEAIQANADAGYRFRGIPNTSGYAYDVVNMNSGLDANEYASSNTGMHNYVPRIRTNVNGAANANHLAHPQMPQELQPAGSVPASNYASHFASPVAYQPTVGSEPFLDARLGWIVRVAQDQSGNPLPALQYPSPVVTDATQQAPYYPSAPVGVPGAVPKHQVRVQNNGMRGQRVSVGELMGVRDSSKKKGKKRAYDEAGPDDEDDESRYLDPVPKRKKPTKLTPTRPARPSTNNLSARAVSKLTIIRACTCKGYVKIPRPRNAFILYRQSHSPEYRPLGLCHGDCSKELGARWRAESEDTKDIWRERAEIEKEEHKRMYPDYKYTPKKNKLNQFGQPGCTCGARKINLQANGYESESESEEDEDDEGESSELRVARRRGARVVDDDDNDDVSGYAGRAANAEPATRKSAASGRRSSRLAGKSVRYDVPGEDDPLPTTSRPAVATAAPHAAPVAPMNDPSSSTSGKKRPAPVDVSRRNNAVGNSASAISPSRGGAPLHTGRSVFDFGAYLASPPALNTRSRTSTVPFSAATPAVPDFAYDPQYDAFFNDIMIGVGNEPFTWDGTFDGNLDLGADFGGVDGNNVEDESDTIAVAQRPAIVGSNQMAAEGAAGGRRRSTRISTAVAPVTPLRTSPRSRKN